MPGAVVVEFLGRLFPPLAAWRHILSPDQIAFFSLTQHPRGGVPWRQQQVLYHAARRRQEPAALVVVAILILLVVRGVADARQAAAATTTLPTTTIAGIALTWFL